MGTFFNDFKNNLKRKFTAPKTRDIPKKIESMNDYLGLAEAEFKKMQEEAVFYKGVETELSKAPRALKSGGELFKGYTVEKPFEEMSRESAFLYGIWNYKCTTLENDDYYNTERQTLEDAFTYESSLLENAVRTKTSENQQAYSPDKCLELFKKYEKFCRTCKQKIKDAFEQKKKQFSKEKTKLMELSKLTKGFGQEQDPAKLITIWDGVRKWSISNSTILQNPTINPAVAQVYNKALEIAKEKVPKAIEKDITNLCQKIYDELAKTTKEHGFSDALTQLKTDFNAAVKRYKLICEHLEENNTLAAIKTTEKKVNDEITNKIGYNL